MAIKIVLENKTNDLNMMSYEEWLKMVIATYKNAQEKEELHILEAQYEGMICAFEMALKTYQEAIKPKIEEVGFLCPNCENTTFIRLSESIICKRCRTRIFGV